MNESRQKVEAFKRSSSSEMMKRVRFSTKYPENIDNLDYHARLKAQRIAEDNTIAQHLGVTLSDHEAWPEEHGKMLAREWAQGLPDI